MTIEEIIKYIEDLGFFPRVLDVYEDENNTIFITPTGDTPITKGKHEFKLIGHIMKGKVIFYE